MCCSALRKVITQHNETLQTDGVEYTRHGCQLCCVNNVLVLTASGSHLVQDCKQEHTINVFVLSLPFYSLQREQLTYLGEMAD